MISCDDSRRFRAAMKVGMVVRKTCCREFRVVLESQLLDRCRRTIKLGYGQSDMVGDISQGGDSFDSLAANVSAPGPQCFIPSRSREVGKTRHTKKCSLRDQRINLARFHKPNWI